MIAQAHRRADDEKKDKEKWESTGAPARAPCSLSRSHHVALFLSRARIRPRHVAARESSAVEREKFDAAVSLGVIDRKTGQSTDPKGITQPMLLPIRGWPRPNPFQTMMLASKLYAKRVLHIVSSGVLEFDPPLENPVHITPWLLCAKAEAAADSPLLCVEHSPRPLRARDSLDLTARAPHATARSQS